MNFESVAMRMLVSELDVARATLGRVMRLLAKWEAESSGDEFKMDEINELKAALEGEEAKR